MIQRNAINWNNQKQPKEEELKKPKGITRNQYKSKSCKTKAMSSNKKREIQSQTIAKKKPKKS